MAATHSYNAVPSILMVAPNGKTKLVTLFDAPAFSSTELIVNGRVAEDDEVENAVSSAADIALKWATGEIPPISDNNSGSVISA